MSPNLKDMLERFDSYPCSIFKEESQYLVRLYYLVGGFTLKLWVCKVDLGPNFIISEQERALVLFNYFDRFKKLLNTDAIRNTREPWLVDMLTNIIDSSDPK